MEPLTYYQCTQLLDKCVKHSVLCADPNSPNNILVYREAGTKCPEGWYSENALTLARELRETPNAQELLLAELRKRKIAFSCPKYPEYPG